MFDVKSRFEYRIDRDEMELYLFYRDIISNKRKYLKFSFHEIEGHSPIDPVMTNDENVNTAQIYQEMMNALWNGGMRPAGFKDSQNETAAIKYHLEDMRKLVFK